MSDRFDELVGESTIRAERMRLRRVHELLALRRRAAGAGLRARDGSPFRSRNRCCRAAAAAGRSSCSPPRSPPSSFGAGWLTGTA